MERHYPEKLSDIPSDLLPPLRGPLPEVPPGRVDVKAQPGGDRIATLGDAFAVALGIPLKRKPVELRKPQDIPQIVPNRAEKRRSLREFRRAATKQRLRMRRAHEQWMQREIKRKAKADEQG